MKITKHIAICLLGLMFVLIFTSAWNDSATMDELAHIPSGYSYLSQKDARLNPEHPPLIKELSALPLMFLNLNFPTDVSAWTTYVNGQWDMGRIFIYESGNDADQILLWSRLPLMLLAILFGWMFFKWVSGLYGDKVALLSLFFFVFSPTLLTHSRYVTTDLGAAFGFFIGIAAFLNFIKRQDTKSLILCGIAFAIAQLLKFSLAILAPLYVIYGVLWVFLSNFANFSFKKPRLGIDWKKCAKEKFLILFKIFLIGIIGLVIIWAVYLFHTWNYPVEKQVSDAEFILEGFRVRPLADGVLWLLDKPVLRSLGEYLLGILMVLRRAAGGNTAYFMGEVTNVGWPAYFPVLYLFKEHLALHILTLIGLLFGLKNIIKSKEKNIASVFSWLRENFALTASFIFIAIYWLQAVTSPLNIGVRHVLPTFPFIYLLVSRQTIRWIKDYSLEIPKNFRDIFKEFYKIFIKPAQKKFIVTGLMVWMFAATIFTFPYYLSYYNELAGGTANGHKIAVDSNYDWGQDLKRLRDFVEENNIEKIGVDYFGGGNPYYYLGDKYESWYSSLGNPAEKGIKWVAISLTFLDEAQSISTKGFPQKNLADTYWWLKGKEPIARAGTSMFIYKLAN